MTNELLYQIALTRIPSIGDVRAKALVQHFEKASHIFTATKKELASIESIGIIGANAIKQFNDFESCESEILFIEKYHLQPLFITSKDYPPKLLNCYDNPVLLYYKGNTPLNHKKVLSVVGTRQHSDYGKHCCEEIIEGLQAQDVMIVSGLAYGIDSLAHKAAIKNNLATIGVLAHGLDTIYPVQNKSLAKEMAKHGGLLTEFPSQTKPDKQNFPKRNRIVAGMCDALLVIESGKKGGSLITAELANSYNRDVFAIPGRASDIRSEGCNYLIKNNKAAMVCSAEDIIKAMSWENNLAVVRKQQRSLFIDLLPDEKVIMELLGNCVHAGIDDIYQHTSLSSSKAAAALLSLEMQGLIDSLPGKIYKLT